MNERKIKVITRRELVTTQTVKRTVHLDEAVLVAMRRKLLQSIDEVNRALNICACENCGRQAS